MAAPGLLAAAFASTAAAQQASAPVLTPAPVFQLETVTVTATRSENKAFDVPASIAVVGREQLDEAQAGNLSILRRIPGVDLGGGARPAGQIPSIRGLQGPRVILSVDGARRNYSDGIRTPLLIDPDMVQQIDIVRGPASALYGGGGIGGVMALRTLEAGDILKDGQAVGGRVKLGARSGDRSVSGNLTGAARSGGVDLLASVTMRDVGRIRTGDGRDLDNDDQLKSGLVKAGVALNDLNKVQVSYQKYSDDVATPSNPGGGRTFGLMQTLQRRQDQFTGSYAFRDAERQWLDGKLTAYHTKMQFKTSPKTTGVNPTNVSIATAGVGLQNTTRFDTGSLLKHRVTYGFDAYRDQARNRDGSAANSVQPDGAQESLGAYLQDEVSIGADWTFIGALRQDKFRLEPVGQAASDNQRLSPKAALHWQAQPFLGLFIGYAEGFRAPTMAETYQNLSTTRALFNFRPNAGLKPEVSRTREVGFTLSFDDVFEKGDAARLKATFFDEDVKNLITSTTVGSYTRAAPFSGTGLIFQNRNVSSAERQGAEVEATYSTGHWDLGLGYAHLRAKDATTGAGLFAPPDKLTLAARYRYDENWSAWWVGQFVDEQNYDATVLRRRDGYGLHDLGVAYDRDWWRADFSVTNLFDKAYATYQQSQTTTYTYEEGRSVNLTLTARF
jgi:hemoglobin/transferrin/lactoferrin receptor protein